MLRDPDLMWGELFAIIIVAALVAAGTVVIGAAVSVAISMVAWPTEITTHVRPNALRTPGEINDNIDQSNIGQTICNPHWSTKSIRPDQDFTTALKRKQLAAYGYANRNVKLYEEDHLISLELGGHPTDAHNLWPEPWKGVCGAHVKDELENKLHDLVCAGKITLAEAQSEIAHDWVRSYNAHIGKLVCP